MGGKRSTLEKLVCDKLDGHGARYAYEPFRLPYVPKLAHYLPDVLLLDNGIIVEVKGWFTSKDRAKHLLIKQQYPALDIRFVFGKAHNLIGKKSTTTYASWCDMKGFRWAEKEVPASWIREAVNKESLRIIKSFMEDK